MFGRLSISDLVTRQRTKTYNPNLTPTPAPATSTAPPVTDDPTQAERDWFFAELVNECRAGHVRESRIDWLLAESGRTREQLDAAIEQSDPTAPATSPTAKSVRVFEKETRMTEHQKRQVRSEWDRAIAAQKAAKPDMRMSQIVSRVVTENPELHARYIEAANS